MGKRKIAVITGSRAEFGILSNLLDKIEISEYLELQLLVTGSHLSVTGGLTISEISKKFKVSKSIEILLNSDSRVGISKAMGLAMISMSEVYHDLQPDIVLILGDRFEIHAAATAALIMGIPIAHIHGGELTEGAWDESLRHSISKLSSLHFTTTERYRERVIQLGESPDRVFNVGSLGVENTKKLSLLNKHELEAILNFKLDNTVMVTVHSETNKVGLESELIQPVLKALSSFEDLRILFTLSNADVGGHDINQQIHNFVQENPDRSIAVESLGQQKYFSALKCVKAVVGNSSSGLIEVPSFGIPTLNIGCRQQGRIAASSVITCKAEYKIIKENLAQILSKPVDLNIHNPYEKHCTAELIKDILVETKLENLDKKVFYDL